MIHSAREIAETGTGALAGDSECTDGREGAERERERELVGRKTRGIQVELASDALGLGLSPRVATGQ